MRSKILNGSFLAVCFVVWKASALKSRAHLDKGSYDTGSEFHDLRPSSDATEDQIKDFLRAYDELLATGLIPAPEAFGSNIRYFHAPKTGSSMLNLIAKRACPRLPQEMKESFLGINAFLFENQKYLGTDYCEPEVLDRGHIFLKEPEVENAVGLFRSAVNITVSKYFYNIYGVPPSEMEKVKGSADPVSAFISYPEVIASQAKMLAGLPDVEPVTLTQGQLELAIDRLKRMKFVGLTDQWVITTFLFAAMFGGRKPELVDFGNDRSTVYDPVEYKNVVQKLGSRNFDPYDGKLFEVATDIFTTRVQKWFGPACEHVLASGVANPLCGFMVERNVLR